jgi:GAF domain-containing protein
MEQKTQRDRLEASHQLYYNFFGIFRQLMKRISSTTQLTEVMDIITEDVAKAIGVKGSTLMLLDRKSKILEIVSSYGLSDRYLHKGPVHSEKSISEGMDGVTVCVDDVSKDPRIQYPAEAVREGICSILSVPMRFKENVIGLLRIYTSTPTEFSYEEIQFVEGLADLSGIAIEYNRLLLGYKHSLDACKKHLKSA